MVQELLISSRTNRMIYKRKLRTFSAEVRSNRLVKQLAAEYYFSLRECQNQFIHHRLRIHISFGYTQDRQQIYHLRFILIHFREFDNLCMQFEVAVALRTFSCTLTKPSMFYIYFDLNIEIIQEHYCYFLVHAFVSKLL